MALVAELVSISLSDKVPRELVKRVLPSPPGPSPALLLKSLSAPRVSPELLLTWKGNKVVRDIPQGRGPEMPHWELSAAIKKDPLSKMSQRLCKYLLDTRRRSPRWNLRVWSRVQTWDRYASPPWEPSWPETNRSLHGSPPPPAKMPVWCSPTTVLTSESWLELRIMTAGLTPMTESESVLWNKTQGLRHTRGGVQAALFPQEILYLLPSPHPHPSTILFNIKYMTHIIRTINTKVVHAHYRKYMKE